MLTRLLDFLRGGSRDFNDAEKRLISFVMDALPTDDQHVLTRQLGSIRLVQRQHPGRLVVAYYRSEQEVPQLPYHGYEYCLAKVSYRSNGGTRATSLVLHNGRLMTLERNVPQTLDDIQALGEVTLHPKGHQVVADETDAEEHERST